MTVYIVAEILVFALAYPFCIYKPNKAKNTAYVVLVFLYLWTLASLRYDVGNDYFSYINIFFRAKGDTWAECFNDEKNIEAGYMLISKVVSLFTADYKVMHCVMSFMCLAPTAYIICKYSKNVWLSCHLYLCLTFYYSSLNFIRQTLAATILFLAFRFFKERKTIPYILVILVASTIHISVLIAIPIYLVIAYMKPTTKVLLVAMILLVVLYIFSYDILNLLAEYLPKYSAYLNTKYIRVGLSQKYLIVPALYMLLMLYAYFEGGYNKERYQIIFVNSSIINFGIWFFITKHFILERFSIFVYIFVMLIVPDVMEHLKHHFIKSNDDKKGKLKYGILMFVVLAVAFGYNVFGMVSGFHGVFPYQTFQILKS